jgi:hypothetical protein
MEKDSVYTGYTNDSEKYIAWSDWEESGKP